MTKGIRRPVSALLALGVAGLGVLLAVCGGGGEDGPPIPRVERDGATVLAELPYVADAQGRRRTLDLYLPEPANEPPLLFAFVHGGFWTLDDDRPRYRIGPGIAGALQAEGIAVALIRYRLAPEHRHPAAARDVAAALAYLVRHAEDYGYDPQRIVVGGHSAGGHLAALTALDPSYLAEHDVEPDALAGAVSISGIHDVTPPIESNVRAFGDELAVRREASPIEHARAGAPPFLVVATTRDVPGFATGAEELAERLRAAGHERVTLRIVPGHDHFSLVRIGAPEHPLREILLAWLRGEPLPAQAPYDLSADAAREQERTWKSFTWMEPFWEREELIRTRPVDARFMERLDLFFGGPEWRDLPALADLKDAREYHALDLFEYLDSLPPAEVGAGEYLVLTNVRDEQIVWTREQIEPYRPVLVIGIDDVKNLFGVTFGYRARREYTWRDDLPRPPHMARPIGAFVHFLEEPPAELTPRMFGTFSLLPRSFRWTDEDPYASIRDVPEDLFEVLTWRNGCVYCHGFREAGTRSFHTTARSARPHGGFALPLEEYPPEAWRRFVFQPHRAARRIGVTPNVVGGDAAQALYDLVEAERGKAH